MQPRSTLAILALIAALPLARAQDSFLWSNGGTGSWANPADWDGGVVASGTDNTAYFGFAIEPAIPTSATFTLNGAETIGNLTFIAQTTPATWALNTGSGGPLTLDTTFDFPGVEIGTGLQMTLNTVIAGTVGLEKLDPGTLVLTATNTYTGGTVLTGGNLFVNGVITDTNPVSVASGTTLGGTGTINGPVTVASGGFFSPGGVPGTFTVSNTLALSAGSKTFVMVNASTLAHDLVTGISTVNYGGTLVVSNLAGVPATGQSFQLFKAAASGGDFSTITPQLTGGTRWEFNSANGTLSVVATNSQPRFSSATLWPGPGLLFSVTNGVPGATNLLLGSTNLTVPRTNWTRLATNIFDAGGNLVFTNTINALPPQRFYLIELP